MSETRFKKTKDPEIKYDSLSGRYYYRGTPEVGGGEITRSLKVKSFGLASMAKKDLLNELRGLDPRDRRVTVSQLFDELEKEQALKSKSTLNKCRAARKALAPVFEDLPVRLVSHNHYIDYVSQARLENPERKLENDILHLNMIMARAHAKKKTPFLLHFKNPDKKRQKKRSPSAAEVAALYKLADSDELRRFITICATMGLRPGEGLSLERNEIDLEGGFLTILALKNKNDNQRRIAMSPEVWAMLREWFSDKTRTVVFPPRFVEQAHPWLLSIDGPFAKARQAAWDAGLLSKNDLTPNSLRHFFATECARQIKGHKTDILHVCEYLDHSLDTYRENYLDLFEDDTKHVAALVGLPK